jgi:hypothetical protein
MFWTFLMKCKVHDVPRGLTLKAPYHSRHFSKITLQASKALLSDRIRFYHFNKKFWEELIAYFPRYDTGCIENYVCNNSSIVACVFITSVMFLPSRCLAMIGWFLPSRAVT